MQTHAGNVTPEFSGGNADRFHGWHLTYHAREQMGLRGITVDQIVAVLKNPGTNVPSQKDDHSRIYGRDGVLAVVDPARRQVMTVGIAGANRHDWESHQAPQSSAPFVEPQEPTPVPVPRRARKRRTEPRAAPVTTTRVNERLWRACLAKADGDVRRLRVLDDGAVMVVNQPR